MLLPVTALVLTSYIPRSGGSPGGKTGSPTDGSTCTQCHSSTLKVKEGWISTDIPAEGYIAGETYSITLTATQSGIDMFGFELTAEDAAGSKIGVFNVETQTSIKLINNDKAVTHTSTGLTASNGTRSWTIKWTAPVEGTGDIGFYAAVNAANGDGGTGGDAIFKTQYLVPEQIDNSIEQFLLEGWLKVYPNPATEAVRFHLNGLKQQVINYQIFNLSGQRVASDQVSVWNTNSIVQISVSDLPTGNYVVHFSGEDLNLKGRFIIIR